MQLLEIDKRLLGKYGVKIPSMSEGLSVDKHLIYSDIPPVNHDASVNAAMLGNPNLRGISKATQRYLLFLRAMEIVKLLAVGYDRHDICSILSISLSTLKNTLKRADKLVKEHAEQDILLIGLASIWWYLILR